MTPVAERQDLVGASVPPLMALAVQAAAVDMLQNAQCDSSMVQLNAVYVSASVMQKSSIDGAITAWLPCANSTKY